MIALPLFATTDHDLASRYQDRVIAYLAQATDWTLCRDICAHFPELKDRAVREIAERSKGQIVSGQKGYRLTAHATTEEIDHAERWLLSQARHMTERAKDIRICRNRAGRAA